jgi:hypothetical protein
MYQCSCFISQERIRHQASWALLHTRIRATSLTSTLVWLLNHFSTGLHLQNRGVRLTMNFQFSTSLDSDTRFKSSYLSGMDFQNGLWNGQFESQQWMWPPGNENFESTLHTPGAIFEISEPDATGGLEQYPLKEPSNIISPNSSGPFSEPEGAFTRVRNKPIPRKGHTKSRRGCFNCKRRKIKCQETQPACGNCEKAGIVCEYPRIVQQQQSESSIIRQPQATNASFSMTDMRLFHHFLVRAYPHLPVGADAVWTLEVPAFAHEVRLCM